MATLEQIGEIASEQLRERVDRLVSALEDDAPDFMDVASLADAVGEFADTIAEIYSDLEQTLMSGLSRGSQRHAQSRPGDAEDEEDTTKDQLLERARELNVHGRSSMAKDELAEAVEAEAGVTKDELLDRAREAGIEGRSTMTKEELREALREARAQ